MIPYNSSPQHVFSKATALKLLKTCSMPRHPCWLIAFGTSGCHAAPSPHCGKGKHKPSAPVKKAAPAPIACPFLQASFLNASQQRPLLASQPLL